MANKLTGELRLDLTQPSTAEKLGELLNKIDDADVSWDLVTITLQPGVKHHGGYRDPLADPMTAGMQLVATWDV